MNDGKADKTPFLKFYTTDWLAGCIGLSFEERGFYLEILIRMWDRKGPLPDDDVWIAGALACNPRSVRKLKAALVAREKLIVVDGFIHNRRMDDEIKKYKDVSVRAELEPNSTRIGREFEPNAAKNSTKSKAEKTPRNQNPDPEDIITNTQSGTAREGFEDFLKGGVGVVREPSPSAVAAVCQQLSIANAEPILATYRNWKGARRARDPDALFRKAAVRIFGRLTPAEREGCKPSAVKGEALPAINVRDVRASSALLASLTKGSRYAN